MLTAIRHRWCAIYHVHHPIAWRLIGGELLEAAGRYMVLPFLAIYLHQAQVALPLIGLVLASGPLANILVGLAGGELADRLGRRPLLIGSTLLGSLTLMGFALATSAGALALLHFLNTATRAVYRPANAAALADVTPPELRQAAFGLRRVSINIGAALGPLLGFWLMALSPALGFLVAGGVMAALGGLALVGIPETAPARAAHEPPPSLGASWRQVVGDPALWFFIACTAGFVGGSRVFTSYLPLIVNQRLPAWVSPAMQSLNPVMVVFLQLPINRLLRRQSLGLVLAAGGGLYACAWVGFALATSSAGMLAMTGILTLGEIVQASSAATFIALLAPAALRGRYEAMANLREVGAMVSSVLAGFVLSGAGFGLLCLILASCMLLAGVAGWWADRLAAGRTAITQVSVPA